MLKKALQLSIVIVLLLSAGVCFAQEAEAGGQERKQRAAAAYSQRSAARERAAKIKQNRKIIKDLNRTIKKEMASVREIINELRENSESFSAEKEAAVKEQLLLIRENRAKFAETLGQIRAERLLLKESRRQENGPGILGNADNILAVQEARIAILRDIAEDIEELIEELLDLLS